MTKTRIPYIAAAWALGTGVLALVWTLTGDGYPFGAGNPDDLHPMRGLPADVGEPLFAVVLLGVGVLALATAGRHPIHPPKPVRLGLLGFGWATAAALLVVVPGTDVLTFAGYSPMLVLGAPFGWPDVNYAEVFDAPLLFGMWAVVGGLLLVGTLLQWQRRTAGACVACGRHGAIETWTRPAAAARWGKVAAYVAAAVPLTYAATRLAWVVAVPLGISSDFLGEMQDNGMILAAAGLGGFAVVGAVLTLGLVQRWGEVFPRWMVGLAGRRVPIKLATVPATIVAVAVASASAGFLTSPEALALVGEGSAATLPMVLWPVWAVALAVATYAYHLRRRGQCATCGRGERAEEDRRRPAAVVGLAA
jgi:hypothetical protein